MLMQPKDRLKTLIYKYLDDRLTETESMELRNYAALYPQVWTTIRRLKDDKLLTDEPASRNIDLSKAMAEVKDPARRKYSQWPPPGQENEIEKSGMSMSWKISAAAVLLIVVAGISLVIAMGIHNNRPTGKKTPLLASLNNATSSDNPQPGGYKATLMADNEEVLLDSQTIGQAPIKGKSQPVQTSPGVLSYVPPGKTTVHERVTGPPTNFPILSIPKGGTYKLILPDGSEAFLNNATSLRYPPHFSGKDRVVELISGEVRFNIVPDHSKPFFVRVKGKLIRVLGTQFMITDYDADVLQTILFSGKVQVLDEHHRRDLNPGQELQVSMTGAWTVKPAENLEGADAWTKEQFDFYNMPLSQVLKRLALWYDLDVDMSAVRIDPPRTLQVSRQQPLLNFLHTLENGQVHLRVAGGKIIVSP